LIGQSDSGSSTSSRVVIFLFSVADITWELVGNITGVPSRAPRRADLAEPRLEFYDFDAKEMITLIDIGQMLFVFVMGLLPP